MSRASSRHQKTLRYQGLSPRLSQARQMRVSETVTEDCSVKLKEMVASPGQGLVRFDSKIERRFEIIVS